MLLCVMVAGAIAVAAFMKVMANSCSNEAHFGNYWDF